MSKVCKRCGEDKPTDSFRSAKDTRDKLRPWCKSCESEYKKVWHQENKEKNRIKRIAKYERNREENIRRAVEWAKANPERRRENALRYYYNHKDKHKVIKAKRTAMEREAPGSFTAADVRSTHKAQDGLCYLCGAVLGDDYHVDHIIPLSRGGSNYAENIACACPMCNLRKGNKTPEEYREMLGALV